MDQKSNSSVCPKGINSEKPSVMLNDCKIMDFVKGIDFSDDMIPRLKMKEEPLDIKSEAPENNENVLDSNARILDFVKDIEFSDDIKPKFEVKEGLCKVESSVDPAMSNAEEIVNFVHNIEFSNDIEPKLEIKEEPMDMEKRTEQPTKNLNIVDYFSIQNEVQWLRNIVARKAKLNKVQLQGFKFSACDNNEVKNISLLYNLPEEGNDYEKK